jgi:hypothetical protein
MKGPGALLRFTFNPVLSKKFQILWFLLPEAKNIVNAVVFGFRGAKTPVFTVFFWLGEFQKNAKTPTI